MFVDFSRFFNKGEKIAVAVSGGKDSMFLLHSLNAQKNTLGISVIALNVEHGIRGKESLSDTAFVKDYCTKNDLPFIGYSVDALSHSQANKLSIEESARILRYECFNDALQNAKCDKIATAHHLSDNAESVLFNLFRGTGAKGASGIKSNFKDKIVRPLLNVSREQIDEYVAKNNLPFVTDATNFDDDYTRNFIRLNIIPQIKQIFPEFESSIARFSELSEIDEKYLNQVAKDSLIENDGAYSVALPCPLAIFGRACILAMKNLGVKKDWEKTHIDDAYSLAFKQNGASVNLPKEIIAVREYDHITFYKEQKKEDEVLPFIVGTTTFNGKALNVKEVTSPDLKKGLFIDLDKLPDGAIIRAPKDGDTFTKFGGGTKKLCDYLTDKKVPIRLRKNLPVLAVDNTVLAIFGLAVSDKVKVDDTTKTILQLV